MSYLILSLSESCLKKPKGCKTKGDGHWLLHPLPDEAVVSNPAVACCLSISLTLSCCSSLLKVTALARDYYASFQFLDKVCLLEFLFLLRVIKTSASLLRRRVVGDVAQIGHYGKIKKYGKMDYIHFLFIESRLPFI